MAVPARSKLPVFAPLAPHHQTTLVAVAFVSLLGLMGDRTWHAWSRAPLINIDAAPRRTVRLQVDVNLASWPELSLLPNIGEALAKRIVETRERQGPFTRLADLRRVRGIGPKTLQKIEPYLAPLPEGLGKDYVKPYAISN